MESQSIFFKSSDCLFIIPRLIFFVLLFFCCLQMLFFLRSFRDNQIRVQHSFLNCFFAGSDLALSEAVSTFINTTKQLNYKVSKKDNAMSFKNGYNYTITLPAAVTNVKDLGYIATALEIYVTGSLNVFNHRSNVNIENRVVSFDIKELGKQLKKIGMLVVQDAVWNRVTINREQRKSTRYYIDEMHLLLKEEQTAAYTVEIWKRFRKWGGVPTGITQNVKDLLSSREVENIFENSDYVYMLNQASGDRQILAKQLNISPHQLSYVTQSAEGEGLLFYGSVILPFVDRFPKDTELYKIITTKLSEQVQTEST